MARPERFELPTARFVAVYSIQLSYGRLSEPLIIFSFYFCVKLFVTLNGGERGIRTLDALLAHTPLAGEHLRPLGQLSFVNNYSLKWGDFFI